LDVDVISLFGGTGNPEKPEDGIIFGEAKFGNSDIDCGVYLIRNAEMAAV
jgi:hypothetical protein